MSYWMEVHFSEDEQKELKFISFCYNSKYRKRLSSKDLIIVEMITLLDQINYALAPMGGMGKHAENSKTKITELMTKKGAVGG